MSSTFARHLALAGFPLVLHGCAPIITHGPVVNRGFSGGVTTVLGSGPMYENGDDPSPFYAGSAAISGAYGWRPSRTSLPALRLGLQVPTEGWFSSDLYVQTPPAWLGPFAGGVGLLAELPNGRRMPYVQGGIQNSENIGVDLVVGRYSHRAAYIGYSIEERAYVNWLSFQIPISLGATVHLHAGMARGHVRKRLNNSAVPYVNEDRWVRLGGATIEFHRRRE